MRLKTESERNRCLSTQAAGPVPRGGGCSAVTPLLDTKKCPGCSGEPGCPVPTLCAGAPSLSPPLQPRGAVEVSTWPGTQGDLRHSWNPRASRQLACNSHQSATLHCTEDKAQATGRWEGPQEAGSRDCVQGRKGEVHDSMLTMVAKGGCPHLPRACLLGHRREEAPLRPILACVGPCCPGEAPAASLVHPLFRPLRFYRRWA